MMPCCGGVPVARPLTFVASPQMQGRVPGQTFPLAEFLAAMSTFSGTTNLKTLKNLPASMSTFAGALAKRAGKVLAAAMNSLSGSAVSLVAVATDDFNRADSATLGANWTKFSGWAGDCGIFTNLAGNSVANQLAATAYTGAGAFNNDQYAQIVLKTPDNGSIIGPAVRVSTTAKDAYVLRVYQGGFFMYRLQNGSVTKNFIPSSLAGWVGADGDVVRLEVVGNCLRAFKNGVLVASFQDDGASGGVLSSGYPGVHTNTGPGTGVGTKCDNWEGGNAFANGVVKLTSHQIAAGMATFAAAVARLTSHAITGAMSTFAGALVKRAGHSLAAGMSTFAGALAKRTGHTITAGMSTFAGDIAGLSSRIRRWVLRALRVRPQLAADVEIRPQMSSADPVIRPQHSVRDRKVRGDN